MTRVPEYFWSLSLHTYQFRASVLESGMVEPWLDQLGDPTIDAATVSRSGALAAAIDGGLLDADPEILADLEQLAALRRAVGTTTVAALLTPPSAAAAQADDL